MYPNHKLKAMPYTTGHQFYIVLINIIITYLFDYSDCYETSVINL